MTLTKKNIYRKKRKMKNTKVFVFFDDVIFDYLKYFGKNNVKAIVEDLKEAMAKESKSNYMILLTKHNITKVYYWLLENDLYKFVKEIRNY